ncbi:MAG: hypothetical protein ACREB5_05205, partial [Sphingomonadaceae bacterium]
MRRIILAAVAAFSFATPAMAKDVVFVTTSAVKDKPTVALDPATAYILLRSDTATFLHLMKDPSAEDQVAYDKLRA